MAKHVLTTPELRMRIRSLRSVMRMMNADPTYQQYRVEKKQMDQIRWELQDCRTTYYARPDKDQLFIASDLSS